MSEVQIRQVRTSEPEEWLSLNNHLKRNFTTGWGAPIDEDPEWQFENIDRHRIKNYFFLLLLTLLFIFSLILQKKTVEMNTPHFHTPVISARYFHTNPSVPHKALNSTQSLQFHTCPLVPHNSAGTSKIRQLRTNPSTTKTKNATVFGFFVFCFLASYSAYFVFWCESDVSKGQICVEETDLCETNGFKRK